MSRRRLRRLRMEPLERREMLSVTFVDSGQEIDILDLAEIQLGDIDGDGDLDAFVVEVSGHQAWLNDGKARLSKSSEDVWPEWEDPDFEAPVDVVNAVLGDLDGDGDLDVLADGQTVYGVLYNNGDGTFADGGERPITNQTISYASLADMDGDEDLDVVLAVAYTKNPGWQGTHTYGGPDEVWLNDGSGEFQDSGQRLSIGRDNGATGIALGDIDGDNDIDAVVANQGFHCAADRIYVNDGMASFEARTLGDAEEDCTQSRDVALADLDGDGDLDIFIVGLNSRNSTGWENLGSSRVWLNDGSGRFTDTGQRFSRYHRLALGDLDGDSDPDAILYTWDRCDIWANQGNGRFDLFRKQCWWGDPLHLALGDLDGDEDPDVLTPNDLHGPIGAVWLNQTVLNPLAGDANRDRMFSQADIVQVLQGRKYKTGEPATWSEGDWNDDGVFDEIDIIAALATDNYLQGPYAALMTKSEADPAAVDELLADVGG